MIGKILSYELKQFFKNYLVFVIYALLIFQGIWYTKGTFDYYVNADLLMNSSAVVYKNLAALGIIQVIITAMITTPVLYKELQFKTGQWLFTSPMKEKRFFIAKFVSAFGINALIALGGMIGVLLTPFVGIGEPHRFGDAPLEHLLLGYVLLTLPNLLLLVSVSFFSIVYFKRTIVAFFAVLFTVMLFLIAQMTSEASGATAIIQILDPFAFVATSASIDTMDTLQRNDGLLHLTDLLMANRLLWLGVSLVLFALALYRFSFKYFLIENVKTSTKPTQKPTDKISYIAQKPLEAMTYEFGFVHHLKKLFTLSGLELKTIVRNTGFKVALFIIVLLNIGQNLLWNETHYIGATYPMTSVMTYFSIIYGIFMMMLMMIWAGELFFKDRVVNFWQINDTAPLPLWVMTLSRLIAISTLALIFALIFLTCGIATQLIKGAFGLIDWELYAVNLLGHYFGWFNYFSYIALAFFVAGVIKHRHLTHIIGVSVLCITLLGFELGLIEQVIYGYSFTPGVEDYSQISGYGAYGIGAKWYALMWGLLAMCFILLGLIFWRRGNHSFWSGLKGKNAEFSKAIYGVVAVCFALFLATRFFIIEQVNGKGNFVHQAVQDEESALYEKKFAHLKTLPHPKYKALDLDIDLYPDERKAMYEAKITLDNSAKSEVLYLDFEEFITVEALSLEGEPLERLSFDETYNVSSWQIPKDKATIELTLKATKHYQGFVQDEAQADLLPNGSLAELKAFLPHIGFDDGERLQKNRDRDDHALERLKSRKAPVNDPIASLQNSLSPDALPLKGEITVSTNLEQKALSSGRLTKAWQEDNRNFYRYDMSAPSAPNLIIASAVYETKNFEHQGIDIGIYYDENLDFNIELYEKSIAKGIDFVNEHLGEFPYEKLNIAQINHYQEDFYATPNFIAISEKEGWYAHTDTLKERAYIYQSTIAQLIKQWLYANVLIANVQGYDMLTVALPNALSLKALQNTLGQEAVALIVQTKQDSYDKEKNNDANQQQPLLYSDGADYVAINKGAIVLFEAIEQMGFERFKTLLQTFVEENQKQYVSFEAFYKEMRPYLSETLDRAFVESR